MKVAAPPARRDRALTPWLALLPLVLLAAMVPAGRAAVGIGIVAVGALTARAAARHRADRSAIPLGSPGAIALAVVASLVLAVAPTLLLPAAERMGHDPLYDVGARLIFVLYGWGASLAALTSPGGARPDPGDDPPAISGRRVAVLVAAAFVWLAVAHALYVGRYAGPGDEVLYLLQSRLFREPGFVRRVDPALARFFAIRQMAIVDGRLFTQYPPGWPAALAFFDALGARWWSGVLLGTLAVWLTWLLGRRLRSPFVGAVAAALLAACYWFVQAAATYGAHTVGVVLAAGAALLLLAGESARGARRALAWVGAGLLLGAELTVRPLTGACVGLSLAGWMALRGRLRPGELVGMLGGLAAGGLGPALALLAFNAAVTGDPLRFGYGAVNGDLVAMGFGMRGYLSYDPRGCPTVVASPFTPLDAAGHLAARAWDVAALALPLFLLVALLLAARAGAWRPRRALVAAFLLLPAVHVFYFFSDTRFFAELFPFLFVGIAVLVEELWRRDAAAGRAVLSLGLAAAATYSALWLALGAATFRGRMAAFEAVERARREHGRVALFVADTSTRTRGVFYALYGFNADRFPGDVVVARDLGPANRLLTERLPGYTPLRLAWDAGGTPTLAAVGPAPDDAALPTCGTPPRPAH